MGNTIVYIVYYSRKYKSISEIKDHGKTHGCTYNRRDKIDKEEAYQTYERVDDPGIRVIGG